MARLSGDEFVVLLERVERRDEADRVSRKIKDNIHAAISQGYRQLGVGVSIGIAMFPEDAPDATSLLRHADTHMYDTKRDGRLATLAA